MKFHYDEIIKVGDGKAEGAGAWTSAVPRA